MASARAIWRRSRRLPRFVPLGVLSRRLFVDSRDSPTSRSRSRLPSLPSGSAYLVAFDSTARESRAPPTFRPRESRVSAKRRATFVHERQLPRHARGPHGREPKDSGEDIDKEPRLFSRHRPVTAVIVRVSITPLPPPLPALQRKVVHSCLPREMTLYITLLLLGAFTGKYLRASDVQPLLREHYVSVQYETIDIYFLFVLKQCVAVKYAVRSSVVTRIL